MTLQLFFDAIGILIAINVALGLLAMRPNPVRAIVFSNLWSALKGGQFEPDGYLDGCGADEIAYDMTLHAPDCEGFWADELTPHVRDWAREAGVKL